jgi:hypothetical protein
LTSSQQDAVQEKFSAQFFVEKLENMMAVSEANRSSALFSLGVHQLERPIFFETSLK